jgi:hypothetical protein
VNTTLQKWLLGLIGLGALYLVVTNPQGVYRAAQAGKNLIGGSETQIITGGRRG